jgi:hypothetical protein
MPAIQLPRVAEVYDLMVVRRSSSAAYDEKVSVS